MRGLACTAVLILAACGGSGEKQDAARHDAARAGTLQPGAWEIRLEVSGLVNSGPLGKMTPLVPPRIVHACLKPESVAAPEARFFAGQAGDTRCTSESLDMHGGRLRGSLSCRSRGGTVRSAFEGRFSSSQYEVTEHSVTGSGTNAVEMETRITGRRTGECTAS